MSRTKHHRAKNKKMHHAPADYRRMINNTNKAKVKAVMQKGDYDNIPKFKQDALYDYL